MICNQHVLNVDLASRIGLEQAIIMQNLLPLHRAATFNKSTIRNGIAWFSCPKKFLRAEFHYLSSRVLYGAISKLVALGLMYQADGTDGSYWMAFTADGIALFDNGAVLSAPKPSEEKSSVSVEEKRAQFRADCEQYVAQYGRPMIESFLNYWGQANGNMLAWEIARRKSGAFDIPRRLATWASKDYNKASVAAQPTAKSSKTPWEALGLSYEEYQKAVLNQ